MSFGPKYDADIPEGHGWREKRTFFPNDARLRRHGFHILSRKKDQPAQWLRGGQTFNQDEALEVCRAEDKELKSEQESKCAGQ